MEMLVCPHCFKEEFPDTEICGQCGKSLAENPATYQAAAGDHHYYQQPTSHSPEVEVDSFEDDIALFVGDNIDHYRRKWTDDSGRDRMMSFNWVAFFFPVYWFGYRKLYFLVFLLAMANLFVDYLLYLFGYEYYVTSTIGDPVTFFIVNAIMSLFIGFSANTLYRKRAERIVHKTRESTTNQHQRVALYLKKGQTSGFGIFLAIVMMSVLYFVPSQFMPANVNAIEFVQYGEFEDTDVTMETLFDTLFTDPSWGYLDETESKEYVRFTGLYTDPEDGYDYHFEITFYAPKGEEYFYVEYLYINGHEWYYDETEYDIIDLLFDLYYEY